MKKAIFSILILLFTGSVFAQPVFDLGLKGGVNYSNLYYDTDDYTSDAIIKSHMGVFSRIGWGRVFIQPEAYFSGKGGDLTSNMYNTITSFDYKSVDVPVLLGVKLINGESVSLHAVAGPVFSGITSEDVTESNLFNNDFYKSHYFSMQYGVGLDVLFLTLDARFEQGINNLYSHTNFAVSNRTFMVSLGFKIF